MKMMMKIVLVVAFALADSLNVSAQSPANLLKVFSTLDSKGNPKGWFSPLVNPVFIDKKEKPADSELSIRVDIKNKSEWGSIQQDIQVKKHTSYSFSCMVKGAVPSLGFLMIKLIDAQGREIKRLKSNNNISEDWEKIQIDFSSDNSEKVSALLRFFQTTDALGESVWFADPKLTIASSTTQGNRMNVKITAPEISMVPLFAGCSVYVKYGEGDYSKCNLKYRRCGDDKWLEAYPPVNIKNDVLTKFMPVIDRMFRGSIAYLNEDTRYEVSAELLDSNGKILNTLTSEFKTLSSSVPVKKIVNITKELKKGPVSLTGIHGSPDGWIKYIVELGTVIEGGSSDEAAVQIKNCSYLLLEGLVVNGGKFHGIDILRSKNIRVVNCDISGWGRAGKQDFTKKGVYYDESAREIDFDNGINIYLSSHVLIERCYVHDPRGTANSWFYYHPEGTQAVGVMSAGCTVLRYNDFIGSDEHRWNDAISGYDNGSKTGGFYRDAEVYGNMLAFGNDDGIEFDGGQMNCRFFRNKVEGFLCGISLAPNMLGPSYVYNNLFINMGDITNLAGSVFKNGGGTTYALGTTFFFNNTAYTRGQGLASVGFGKDKNPGKFNGYSRNNLLACRVLPVTDRENNLACDFDYDLMCNQDWLDNNYCKAAPGMEKHGVIALPKFKKAANADFNLSAGSRGIGEGVVIPNFAPGTDGRTDIGAFEAGKSTMLPYRPIPLTCDKGQLNLKTNLKDKTSTSENVTITVNPGSNWSGRFKIVKNQSFDWITVEPPAGTFKAEKPLQFTVKAEPSKIKKSGLIKGLFMARLEDGFSIPVTVYAVATSGNAQATVKVENASDLSTGNDPACITGKYYILDKANWDGASKQAVEFSVEVPAAGIYYVFMRVKSPSGSSAEHNSCYIAIDGETPQKIFFENAPCWVWTQSLRFPNNKKEPGTALNLTAGKHSIKVYPRKTLLLNTVVVSPDPILE